MKRLLGFRKFGVSIRPYWSNNRGCGARKRNILTPSAGRANYRANKTATTLLPGQQHSCGYSIASIKYRIENATLSALNSI
jgi:hypothetical protein